MATSACAASLPTVTDSPRQNYFHLLDGWRIHPDRAELSLATREVFAALLHEANKRWFPHRLNLFACELAQDAHVAVRTVKRSLASLQSAGFLQFEIDEANVDRRVRVKIEVDYDQLLTTRKRALSRRQAGSKANESASGRLATVGNQSSCGSSDAQVQQEAKDNKICPQSRTTVLEVGEELRAGSACPKCRSHSLVVRFKTDAGTRTKERFLACSGYATGACSGFTRHLSSTNYTPGRRALERLKVGAAHVPGRPPLVGHASLEGLQSGQENEKTPTESFSDLSDWLSKMRYAPESVMLDSLATFEPELADKHRSNLSAKREILLDVRLLADQ